MKYVLVMVPTYETISTETFESIWKLRGQSAVHIDFKSIKGYDCARARNECVKYFLSTNNTYLMMVDSDIVLPGDIFEDNPYYMDYLVNNENTKDIILGWYPRKNEPTKTEIFMNGYDGYPAAARWNCSELRRWPREIVNIKGGGFGCAIIPRYVFEAIEFPYFKYDLRDDGTYISEDLYFCNKAREVGFKINTITTLGCNHVKRSIVKANPYK